MDSRNYEKTGRLIARKREERGLTRNQLAEKIGVTSQAVGNWENGKRFPDADIQVKIFEILGLNPVELFAGLEMYDADAKANAASLMERMDEKVFAGGVVRDEDGNELFLDLSGYQMLLSKDGEEEKWVSYSDYYNILPPQNPLHEEPLPVSEYDPSKIYLNAGPDIFIIPIEILESIGKPLFFEVLTNPNKDALALRFTDKLSENGFDISAKLYDGKWRGLRVFGGELTGMLCKAMGIRRWIDMVDITPDYDEESNALYLRLDKARRINVDIAYSEYLLPQWQYDKMWEEEPEEEEPE